MTHEYTTQQVADALGVPKRTLLSWLRNGLLREPRFAPQGGVPKFRWWTQSDLDRAARLRDTMRTKKEKKR